MRRLSKEHRKFKITNRCPKCRKFIMQPRYYRHDGSAYPLITLILDNLATAECPRCRQRWAVYDYPEPMEGLAVVQELVETVRAEEPIGDEFLTIDNSATSTSSLRRLKVTRRWAQKCDIQIERATTSTNDIILSVPYNLVKYGSKLETAVKKDYGISIGEEQTFEEEIELTVPARTIVKVRLSWKRLWQEGYATVMIESVQVKIPFRTVLGITFDQKTIDT
jgi:hypothetical protein